LTEVVSALEKYVEERASAFEIVTSPSGVKRSVFPRSSLHIYLTHSGFFIDKTGEPRTAISFDGSVKVEYQSDLIDLLELCAYFEHVVIAEVEPYVFVGSEYGDVLEQAKDMVRRTVGCLPRPLC
jgi:hypothetical protein